MKCLIIEDEIPAQEVLLNYIKKTSYIQCLGVFETVTEIPLSIFKKIDFIFLDIQLPEINGLEFLKNLEIKPKVIITTAYREYAIDAFEEAVVDYLLKPFSYKRFIKTILRVQNLIGSQANTEASNELFVYADKTYHYIDKNDIEFLKAEVDYVNIILPNKKILIQDSLNNWSNKLSSSKFIRVHRSYIINFNKIDKIERNQIFINNHVIPIGNTYKEMLFSLIKK